MASHHDNSHARPLNEEFFAQEEGEFRIADAFQGAPNRAASRASWLQLQPRRPRPFPSSNVLTTTTVVRDIDEAAAAASTKPTCPLIQEFLQSLGKSHLLNDIAMKRGRGGKERVDDDDDGHDEENGTSGTKTVNLQLLQQQQGTGQKTSLATSGTLVSKITAGQHRRFLQLSGDHDTITATAPRTPQTNKEYRRLKSLVKAEQQLYAQHLHQFWLSHVDRLQVGFCRGPGTTSSCSFVQLAMTNVTLEQWLHRKLPLQYGRCRQVISLRPTGKSNTGGSSTETSSRKQKERNTILDSLQSEIVFQTDEESTPRTWVQNLPPGGSVIGDPASTTTKNDLVDDATNSSSCVVPIQSDERAFELARKHGATMVTTFQTLLVLFTTCISSKAPATSWIVPVSRSAVGGKTFRQEEGIDPSRKIKILDRSSDLIILESPTQLSFSSTREWVTAGLEEGLNRWLEEKSSTSSKKQGTENGSNNSSSSTPCYTYTLLTLPSPARNKPCRVLVRQHDRFFCASGKCPLRVHAHLEYFSERGQREIPSIFDKAVWMLDYVLQPFCRVVVAKVDPACGRILEWDEVSLAHALTLPSSLPKPLLPVYDEDVNSSIDHLWQQLDHLVTMAIPTIGQGQHVLCYPARFGTTMKHDPSGRQPRHHSISVHQPHNSLSGGNEEVLVDMSAEIPLARAMNDEQLKCLSEPDAVRRCYRPWQWETTAENVESQIPYTFPVAVVQSKAAAGAVRNKA